TTTTDPVTDAYGKAFPIDVAGSGRLNVTRASSANLIIIPHELVFNLSYENPNETRMLQLHPIDNSTISKLKVRFSSDQTNLVFNYTVTNNAINAQITDYTKKPGDYEGFIIIDDMKTVYHVPVLVHVTKGTLKATQNNTHVGFSISYPDKWSYAKISLTKVGSRDVKTVGITPQESREIIIHSTGEYWIQSDIMVGNETDHAYYTLMVNHIQDNYFDVDNILQIPTKQVTIISSITIIAAIVTLVLKRK
ncbi:MAG TPA: hypothetical protein VFA69_09230, partial [Candidatus Nitrosotalea sp.]|nr:hypothetical protein [Candidatus Nitrosotalea sp.]